MQAAPPHTTNPQDLPRHEHRRAPVPLPRKILCLIQKENRKIPDSHIYIFSLKLHSPLFFASGKGNPFHKCLLRTEEQDNTGQNYNQRCRHQKIGVGGVSSLETCQSERKCFPPVTVDINQRIIKAIPRSHKFHDSDRGTDWKGKRDENFRPHTKIAASWPLPPGCRAVWNKIAGIKRYRMHFQKTW